MLVNTSVSAAIPPARAGLGCKVWAAADMHPHWSRCEAVHLKHTTAGVSSPTPCMRTCTADSPRRRLRRLDSTQPTGTHPQPGPEACASCCGGGHHTTPARSTFCSCCCCSCSGMSPRHSDLSAVHRTRLSRSSWLAGSDSGSAASAVERACPARTPPPYGTAGCVPAPPAPQLRAAVAPPAHDAAAAEDPPLARRSSCEPQGRPMGPGPSSPSSELAPESKNTDAAGGPMASSSASDDSSDSVTANEVMSPPAAARPPPA